MPYVVSESDLCDVLNIAARAQAGLVRLTVADGRLTATATSVEGHRYSAWCDVTGEGEWTDGVLLSDLMAAAKAASGPLTMEPSDFRLAVSGGGVSAKLAAANPVEIALDESQMAKAPVDVVPALANAARVTALRTLGVVDGRVTGLHGAIWGVVTELSAKCPAFNMHPITAASMSGLYPASVKVSSTRLVASGEDDIGWSLSLPLGTDKVPDTHAALQPFTATWTMNVERKAVARAAAWVNGLIERGADVRHCSIIPDTEANVAVFVVKRDSGEEFTIEIEATFDGEDDAIGPVKVVVPNLAMLIADQDDLVVFEVLTREAAGVRKNAILTTKAGRSLRWAMLVAG